MRLQGLPIMNKAAQELGRMGKGKAKTLTQAERKRRAQRLAEARKHRWPENRRLKEKKIALDPRLARVCCDSRKKDASMC